MLPSRLHGLCPLRSPKAPCPCSLVVSSPETRGPGLAPVSLSAQSLSHLLWAQTHFPTLRSLLFPSTPKCHHHATLLFFLSSTLLSHKLSCLLVSMVTPPPPTTHPSDCQFRSNTGLACLSPSDQSHAWHTVSAQYVSLCFSVNEYPWKRASGL